MEKEETLLRKRLIELSNTAYQRGIVTYTDFLNLNELNILHTTPKDEFAVPYRTFGGYASSERQMAAFLPDAFYMYMEEAEILEAFPIAVVKIAPLHEKFAEELGHRDFLGALLNLGIDRAKLGDILIQDGSAYVFASDTLAEFIEKELVRVRHTAVMAKRTALAEFSYEPRFEEIQGTVASVRLDSLLSLAFGSSRSRLTPFIEGGRVYVNGKLVTSNGCHLKNDDIISVRGMGRFQYKETAYQTKKGRCSVVIHKYV